MPTSLNLSTLGAELDQARRGRSVVRSQPQARYPSGSSSSPVPIVSTSKGIGASTREGAQVQVQVQVQVSGRDRTTVQVQEVSLSPKDDEGLDLTARLRRNEHTGVESSPPSPSDTQRRSESVSERSTSEVEVDGVNIDMNMNVDKAKEASKSESESESKREKESERERPYPLCLLCLTRPPSAVLLPCCHLNLCYLCAPLLIEKHRPPAPCITSTNPLSPPNPASSSSTASRRDTPVPPHAAPEYTRTPYNVLLFRAIANHPKSRAMAMGGYDAPQKGCLGGEMDGWDLVPDDGDDEEGDTDGDVEGGRNTNSGNHSEEMIKEGKHTGRHEGVEKARRASVSEKERRTGINVEYVPVTQRQGQGGRGRIALSSLASEEEGLQQSAMGGRGGAVCLVCRQGVKGWLRVYTG
ncbi:hypothetical protein I316_02388 [Kwoniella heveanensis BCC8398]|uniref:Uncharacterized protein n=1 Tax=Kwoniella heveanensis BCC8398 TaxID=1296120 RepID=A0A1B9GXW7_9TREE|nr:hypothetical protein I316_02388 [Kwoniella heveanensis BCC8398]